MKRHSKQIHAVAASLSTIMLIQQTACIMEQDEADAAEYRMSQMDAEDVFREIMFPNEQAAKKVPELARIYEFVGLGQLSPEQQDAITSIQDTIITNAHSIDPEFMERFAKKIRSGKVLEVEAALMEAQEICKKSLQMLGGSLQLLLEQENLEDLEAKLSDQFGYEASQALLEMKQIDPEMLEAMVTTIEAQLVQIGVPDNTKNTSIATTIDSQLNLSTHLQSFMQISGQLDTSANLQLQSSVDLALQNASSIETQTSANISSATASTKQVQLQTSSNLQTETAHIVVPTLDSQLSINTEAAASIESGNLVAAEFAAVAAVAVAVVAVAVYAVTVFWPETQLESGILNGDSKALFREQMIANITKAYAE